MCVWVYNNYEGTCSCETSCISEIIKTDRKTKGQVETDRVIWLTGRKTSRQPDRQTKKLTALRVY